MYDTVNNLANVVRWYRWRAAVGLGHRDQIGAVNNGAYYQGA